MDFIMVCIYSVKPDCIDLGLMIAKGYDSLGLAGVCTLFPNFQSSNSLANIGAPLSNTSVMIVSGEPSLKIVPRGAVGELCFGGDQVVSSVCQ